MQIDYLENKNGERIDLKKFTVLVGPNNAGKSRTLRDIHEHFVNGKNAKPVIMDKIGTSRPNSLDDVLSDLKIKDHPNSVGTKQILGVGSKLTSRDHVNFNFEQLEREFNQSTDSTFTFGNIAKFRVSYLDANSRLNVAKRTNSYNP